MSIDTQTTGQRTADPLALHHLQPIRALSSMRLHELARTCAPETVVRGDNPFKTGATSGQSVYLLSGELKLAFADGSSSVLVGGSDATHWPLGRRESEILSAKAITDIELIRVDDETLDILMTWDQLSAGAGNPASTNHARPAKTPEEPDWRQMSGAFRLQSLTYGALARLPSASIDQLFQRFERIKAKAGEVVVLEGDKGDFYYIVESGRCAVTRKVGGVDMALAELKAGDAFGEEALVAESTRNATVRMKMAGVLLRLKKDDFIELLREPLLRRLSAMEARQHVATGAAWLDVRYPAEYQHDRLPGAINVPLNEIRNAIGLLETDRDYVVYCQSGRRSSAAAFLLSQRGHRAYWLEGGLNKTINEHQEDCSANGKFRRRRHE